MERRILGTGAWIPPSIAVLIVMLTMMVPACFGSSEPPANGGTMAVDGLLAQADSRSG